ncbi:preprotein translocase subunit SecG [Thermoactinomyces sp. DSM 45891]|uniref:preprotein translocase subunit SecG n=1 Tax=Thermoactinomyces sp. DSM 45891 TaxID=1761907 RepID=UPI00091B9AC1|nr:preprotein translocase subunit SecG [Thermoactinomyces sp. DSM 45891]SFX21739.1 preprotein translocase subunit SecG [Thermoactinomyces sp. DSM 45891]
MALAAKVFLAVISVLLIVVVLLQSSKSPGLSGVIGGGAEQVMGKAKARGIDALLSKLTAIFATLFMIMAIVVAFFLK